MGFFFLIILLHILFCGQPLSILLFFFFPSFWLDHFTLTFSGGKQVQQWQCEEILMEEKEIIFLDPINIFNFGGEIRDPSIFAPQKQHTLHPNNFPPSIFGFGD